MKTLPVHIVALIIISCGAFIGPLGMTAVTVAIPKLASELQASAILIGWIPTAYLLGTVIFMLPCGKIADNIGRKRVYAFGLVFNSVAAFMSAMETSIEWLLVWRFAQGAAGAMIFGVGIALVSSVVSPSKRGMALGITSASVYIGLTMAPVIGGWLTDHYGWRAVFYMQVPLGILLAIAMYTLLKGEWKNDTKKPLDALGTLIFASFTTLLVLGMGGLPAPRGVVMLLLSLLCLFAFISHQNKSQTPLLRPQLFSESRVFTMSLMSSFLMYGSNFALSFLLSLYLQYIKQLTPSEAGQIILLQAISMALTAPIAGRLSDRIQPRIIASAGCFIFMLGYLALSQISLNMQIYTIGGALIMLGIGFGLFSTPNNNAIIGSVPKDEVGVAASTMNLSRTIGNLFGMSIVNLIVFHYVGNKTFSQDTNHELLQTLSLAFSTSCCFVITAFALSCLRGRVTRNEGKAK